MKNKFEKLDKKSYGLIVGISLPIISYISIWLLKNNDYGLKDLMHYLTVNSDVRNNVLILALVPSLLLFYITNFRLKMNRFTVGLVGVTTIMAVIVILLTVF